MLSGIPEKLRRRPGHKVAPAALSGLRQQSFVHHAAQVARRGGSGLEASRFPDFTDGRLPSLL